LGGLRVILVAIVANAAYIFGRKNFKNANDVAIAMVAGGLFLTRLHPAGVLLIASFLGILLTRKNIQPTTDAGVTKTFRFFLSLMAVVGVCALILFFVNKQYFTLATVMLRIDLFSFGGGLAAMPIMYHELVDVFHWFDEKTFLDGIILGQVTPGSIIIAATFFGYLHFGVAGSILATICIFTPSFLILMGIVPFFNKLRVYPQFNKVVNGILCSFVGLLVVITYRFTLGIHWGLFSVLTALAAFILLVRNVDVLWIIVGGIAISVISGIL